MKTIAKYFGVKIQERGTTGILLLHVWMDKVDARKAGRKIAKDLCLENAEITLLPTDNCWDIIDKTKGDLVMSGNLGV